jgi:hypothetical protein
MVEASMRGQSRQVPASPRKGDSVLGKAYGRPVRKLLFAAALAIASLVAAATVAQTAPKSCPIVVDVVGHGEILVIVADGTTRPCDASNNRVLFNGRAKAGDQIKAVSTTGAVCVDHTYGTFRQSQWAGPAIWSAGGRSRFGSAPSPKQIEGTVSTDAP